MFVIFFLAPIETAGFGNRVHGARSVALGNATVASTSSGALFQNQAGLGFNDQFLIELHYGSIFGLKEYAQMAVGLVAPVGEGSWAVSYSQFGTGIYRESKLGLAHARSFGELVAAALQFNYLAEVIPENRTPLQTYTFELGMLFMASDKVVLGMHFFNPVSAKMNVPWDTVPVPRVFRFGEVWKISDILEWSIEAEKVQSWPWTVKSGIEFNPHPSLFFRGGIMGRSFQPTAGFGFHTGTAQFDIGFSYHGNLGFSPAASLTFNL